jgi:hypothetical protein
MDRHDFINNKFITVSGRSGSMDEFVAEVKKNLFDNYDVVAVHGLGEFGIDDKERYLAFVTGESDMGKNFFAQEQKLLAAQLGAHTHANLEDAYDYSKEKYETFGEEQVEKQTKFEQMTEKFPPTKAQEIEQFNILEALWASGRISFTRCLFDGEPSIVLIAVSPGADEIRVRPLAMLVNEDIETRIEFPNDDE